MHANVHEAWAGCRPGTTVLQYMELCTGTEYCYSFVVGTLTCRLAFPFLLHVHPTTYEKVRSASADESEEGDLIYPRLNVKS